MQRSRQLKRLICYPQGTTTTSRAGSAAVFGAVGGAAIGSLSANAGRGILIGVGALGGFLYDQHRKGNID
jgi:hypothetical protein